jgi:hypothetical protein
LRGLEVYSLAGETMAFEIAGIENEIPSGIGFYWGPETASEFIQDITNKIVGSIGSRT